MLERKGADLHLSVGATHCVSREGHLLAEEPRGAMSTSVFQGLLLSGVCVELEVQGLGFRV